MKIKDLIKELEKLDGEKTIGVFDIDNELISNLDIEEYNETTFPLEIFTVINNVDYAIF